jgi:hypothetical protein
VLVLTLFRPLFRSIANSIEPIAGRHGRGPFIGSIVVIAVKAGCDHVILKRAAAIVDIIEARIAARRTIQKHFAGVLVDVLRVEPRVLMFGGNDIVTALAPLTDQSDIHVYPSISLNWSPIRQLFPRRF